MGMITREKAKEAIEHLKEAAKILYHEKRYSDIELLAAFNCGIETITEPVYNRKESV